MPMLKTPVCAVCAGLAEKDPSYEVQPVAYVVRLHRNRLDINNPDTPPLPRGEGLLEYFCKDHVRGLRVQWWEPYSETETTSVPS